MGVPEEKFYDNRLYRALDKLLPHKGELEVFLKEKLGELFELEYDLLLYDVTSSVWLIRKTLQHRIGSTSRGSNLDRWTCSSVSDAPASLVHLWFSPDVI